jgi:hypothetical protein
MQLRVFANEAELYYSVVLLGEGEVFLVATFPC